jgi:hypothetical protein
MKKYVFMCAGALILAAACTDEEKSTSAAFIGAPSSIVATPKEQSIEATVWRITGQDVSSQLNVSVAAEVVAKQAASVSKVTVTIDGAASKSLIIPAGQTSVGFTIKVKQNATLRSTDDVSLKLTLTNSGAYRSGEGDVTISIKSDAPLTSAPPYAMLEGRTRADTLWFGVNSKYYDNLALTAFSVKVKKNDGSYEDATSFTKIDSIKAKAGKIGVVIPKDNATRNGWKADDTVSIYFILPAQTGGDIADTLLSKFVVQADELASAATYNFTDPRDGALYYYALFAGKEGLSQNAAQTDVVFYLDTAASGGTDSTFVLKMLASDSCTIAVVPSTKEAYKANLRTNDGAQDVTDYPALTKEATIAPTTGYISITDYDYFAVKMTYWKPMEKKVDDKVLKYKENTTYYGYLRLKTIMSGPKGEVPTFEKVEFTLNYGEARDYAKEK